jgi:hypothetical protein
MKQAVPYIGRYFSKLFFEIIPGALVSVLAAYFLNVLHLARGAEPAVAEPPAVTQSDGLSADERRELTRQMLRERRENPEETVEVKPLPSLRPTAPAETADLAPPVDPSPAAAPGVVSTVVAPPVVTPEAKPPEIMPAETKPADIKPAEAKPADIKPADAKPRPESTRPAVATATPSAPPLPRTPAPRARPEPPAVAAVAPPASPLVTGSLPPPIAPGAGPPSAATPLPPVTVNTTPPEAAAEPPRRGIVGSVFSGISTFAGGAANVTGNTVNWVIDLPGKAISAGGKLLGVNSGSAPAPTAAPGPGATPPAAPSSPVPPAADPQRRNYL